MRRSTKIAAVVAATTFALAGCAGNDTTAGEDTETDTDVDICKTADGAGPKIGLAFDVGGVGDQSFNDSAVVGLTQAVEDLDATCQTIEAAANESDADREERLRLLADEGFNPIIAVGFVYSPATATVAAEYPKVSFAVVDGYVTFVTGDMVEVSNAADLTFAANEASFLVGVAAALTTKTDNVGFVGGTEGPLIQAFEAGYVAGVETVDPKIEVQVQYLAPESDPVKGFENPPGGETAATGMYDNGADVVYHAAGKSGLGVFDAVEAAGEGNWAIGVDSDQYLTVDAAQQPFILTSALKRVDTSVLEYVTAFDAGKAPAGVVTYDLESGGVGYSTSGGFVDDIADQIDDYKQQIIDGKIKVPTEPAN